MSEERKFKATFGNIIGHLEELYKRTEPKKKSEPKKTAPKKEYKNK